MSFGLMSLMWARQIQKNDRALFDSVESYLDTLRRYHEEQAKAVKTIISRQQEIMDAMAETLERSRAKLSILDNIMTNGKRTATPVRKFTTTPNTAKQ